MPGQRHDLNKCTLHGEQASWPPTRRKFPSLTTAQLAIVVSAVAVIAVAGINAWWQARVNSRTSMPTEARRSWHASPRPTTTCWR
jgi:hypothetical protein